MAIGARARLTRDLVVVHEHFLGVLERVLGYAVPVPPQLQGNEDEPERAQALRRWLGLLDRALTPQMLREDIREATDLGLIEPLLRYFVAKQSPDRIDRDKTDLVATQFYKRWSCTQKVTPAASDAFTTPHFARVPEFAGPLYMLLSDIGLPEVPEEHRQLLREFPFVRQEIEEFRCFDELVDSGLLQRVRDIKESFGRSMYHPHVLAAFAECNTVLGNKFETLFHVARKEITAFVQTVEFSGGSLAGRVYGDVTVKQLTDVMAEEELLAEEHEVAGAKFLKLAKLIKAVERSRGRRQPAAGASRSEENVCQQRTTAGTAHDQLARRVREMKEASFTRAIENSIRNFVRAADPNSSLVVPMRKGNIALTPVERDAFCADYCEENSFRGSYALAMVNIVSLTARLHFELEDLREKRESAHLWIPHANTLAYLLNTVPQTTNAGAQVADVAEQRGLADKVKAMSTSIEKLQQMARKVSEALGVLGTNTALSG